MDLGGIGGVRSHPGDSEVIMPNHCRQGKRHFRIFVFMFFEQRMIVGVRRGQMQLNTMKIGHCSNDLIGEMIKGKYASRPNWRVAKALPKISEFALTLIS